MKKKAAAKPKTPLRGSYKPRAVHCHECDGRGHYWARAYPSSQCIPSKRTCPHCNGKGVLFPRRVNHEAGCTGCGGIYLCAGCKEWCGYCNGAADDMPEHCDDCWAKAHPAPKRRTALLPGKGSEP